jgi:hypothetical protein
MGQMGTAKSHMQQPKIPRIIGSGLLSYTLYISSLIYELLATIDPAGVLTMGGLDSW